jgi:beta-xylosidase
MNFQCVNDSRMSSGCQTEFQFIRYDWQKATVTLTNKNARIIWAVMTGNKRYGADNVSILPAADMSATAWPSMTATPASKSISLPYDESNMH